VNSICGHSSSPGGCPDGSVFLKDEIISAARELLGRVCENEPALELMCQSAENELSARLKERVRTEDIREEFIGAAAMLALSMYMQFSGIEEWSSFKAGNLSVSRRGSGAARSVAAALRKQAEGMLWAYMEDGSFDFRGVWS